MESKIKAVSPVVVGVVALAMLFYLVISGEASADLLVPVLIGALSGLGVDSVHRRKQKKESGK